VKSRVYNIGTGVGVTLRDFERVIKKHIPNAQMEIGGGLNFYVCLSRDRRLRHHARPRGAGLSPAI
jgi:hypothetical protein